VAGRDPRASARSTALHQPTCSRLAATFTETPPARRRPYAHRARRANHHDRGGAHHPGDRDARCHDAGVSAFIEKMLTDWHTPTERERFLAGLQDLDARCRARASRDFVACSEADQVAVLTALDAAHENGSTGSSTSPCTATVRPKSASAHLASGLNHGATMAARRSMPPTDFDAIVVGSGMTGGWAAKELTELGLRTLVLEAGRPITPEQDYVEHKPSWEMPFRGLGDRRATASRQPIQSHSVSFDELSQVFWTDDVDNPYSTPADRPFYWFRARQVGGKSIIWGRQVYRWSDLDFEANLRDGVAVDWQSVTRTSRRGTITSSASSV